MQETIRYWTQMDAALQTILNSRKLRVPRVNVLLTWPIARKPNSIWIVATEKWIESLSVTFQNGWRMMETDGHSGNEERGDHGKIDNPKHLSDSRQGSNPGWRVSESLTGECDGFMPMLCSSALTMYEALRMLAEMHIWSSPPPDPDARGLEIMTSEHSEILPSPRLWFPEDRVNQACLQCGTIVKRWASES